MSELFLGRVFLLWQVRPICRPQDEVSALIHLNGDDQNDDITTFGTEENNKTVASVVLVYVLSTTVT